MLEVYLLTSRQNKYQHRRKATSVGRVRQTLSVRSQIRDHIVGKLIYQFKQTAVSRAIPKLRKINQNTISDSGLDTLLNVHRGRPND